MTIKAIYLIIIELLVALTSFSQTRTLDKIDKELTALFQTTINTDYELRDDSSTFRFKRQLMQELLNPITFHHSLDSLSKYITVKASPDKKIKFYSWDNLDGGTWHNINCFAQFSLDNGKIVVQQINAENEAETTSFTDSKIYEVNKITIGKKTHYLTFGWGTHGSGHEHQIIQIFTITDDKLVKCESCFENNGDLVIEYPRNQNANLVFDNKTNEISYAEFKLDDEIGFYQPTGQVIKLKLSNGRYRNR